MPPQEDGFYRIRSTLERDGIEILEKETTFAVMDRVGEYGEKGEFGWVIADGSGNMTAQRGQELAESAREAGVNWLKFPLWQSVYSDDSQLPNHISKMFDSLVSFQITPVGLLNNPPTELRRQFAEDWTGISEIFTMPPHFWRPKLEPVIARFSSNVRYWQLGSDADTSFVGMSRLPETLDHVRREFDQIGRDTRIGLRWDWKEPIPSRAQLPQTFFSLVSQPGSDGSELISKLRESRNSGLPLWVVLKPLPVPRRMSEESQQDFVSQSERRGADLVKRMVAAKIGGANAIFAYNVFDRQYGLLHENGSPTLLFLPWRTTAMALKGTEFLGSFNMPGGSKNFVFAGNNEVVMIVWNDDATGHEVNEKIYLGEKIEATDVWGRQWTVPVDPENKQQLLKIGPTPLVIRGCSEPVARWRIAVRLQEGRLASISGGQAEAILGRNTFPQGVSGQATLRISRRAREWEIDPSNWPLQLGPGEPFELKTLLKLPLDASLGSEVTSIDFDFTADRHYKIRVYRTLKVGLGDVVLDIREKRLDDGELEILQIITNNTEPPETLNFKCTLSIRERKRQKEFVTKLGIGQDKKYYYVPDASSLEGKTIWLRAEQVGGPRVLNKHWVVGQSEDEL